MVAYNLKNLSSKGSILLPGRSRGILLDSLNASVSSWTKYSQVGQVQFIFLKTVLQMGRELWRHIRNL